MKKRASLVIGGGAAPAVMSQRSKVFRPRADLLPTGSTLLNLALAENPYGGYLAGTLVNPIGDTHAGKTMLYWQGMAETAHSKLYDRYDLYYKDAESSFNLNVQELFGSKTVKRVNEESTNILLEPHFVRIKTLLKGKHPIVYGVDSLDNMRSKEEMGKSEAEIGKRDYPDKPRIMNEQLGFITELAAKSGSVVVYISQTRSNIGVMFGPTKRRSGGDALHFYATHEFWLAVAGHITRRNLEMGIVARIRVSKNKVTGKQREVEVPILVDYGVDDIGSMVDWMLKERFWIVERKKEEGEDKKKRRTIKTLEDTPPIKTEGDFKDGLTRKDLIRHIEDVEGYDDLRQIVSECWMKNEREAHSKRMKRYS